MRSSLNQRQRSRRLSRADHEGLKCSDEERYSYRLLKNSIISWKVDIDKACQGTWTAQALKISKFRRVRFSVCFTVVLVISQLKNVIKHFKSNIISSCNIKVGLLLQNSDLYEILAFYSCFLF